MKKYYKKILLLCGAAVTLSAMMLAGCASQPSASSNASLSNDSKRLNVITSFYPMYDFAKKIGGEYVDVTNLVPAGTEPHDWEPSTSDITNLEHADVFVYNGAGMESWTDKVLSTLSNKSLTTVEASQNIALRVGGEHEHEHDEDENHTDEEAHDEEHYDPHVWLNPLNAKKEMAAKLDVGFRVFKLDTSNLETWDATPIEDEQLDLLYRRMNSMIHRVKPERTDLDMIYEIMLKLGVPLTYSVTPFSINNKTVYGVGDDCLLLVCLAEDVQPEDVEQMTEYAPAKIIISRDSFADDTAMANAYYILRDHGIELKLV